VSKWEQDAALVQHSERKKTENLKRVRDAIASEESPFLEEVGYV
jgi:hypothetical protein